MSNQREPLRGEIWDVAFRTPPGRHPAVLITANRVTSRRSDVNVALITGTDGPRITRVPLDADAGLTGHDESYVDLSVLHLVPLTKLIKYRGRVSRGEMAAIETGIRFALGLD